MSTRELVLLIAGINNWKWFDAVCLGSHPT
jgi:hypothetical protein